MKILVTAGSGFLGSNLVTQLCTANHEVAVGYSPRTNDLSHLKVRKFGKRLRTLGNEATYFNDLVFHLAANNDVQSQNQSEMMESNFHAPKELFQKFAEAGCRRFVYASSAAVYGNSTIPFDENTPLAPLTPYGESKARFDKWAMDFAQQEKINVVGLRFTNLYGPGESYKKNQASMIHQIISRCSVGDRARIFWDGSHKRDWCYIKDAVRANLLAMKYDGAEIFNIGSGRSMTFHDVLDAVNKGLHQGGRPVYIPNPFIKTYQYDVQCKIDKATELLGYNPIYDLDLGIEDYLREWI